MKKCILISTLFVVNHLVSIGQISSWMWVNTSSCSGDFNAHGVRCVSDANDNVIVVGDFTASAVTFGTTVLTNTAEENEDIFIVKYNSAGSVLWAKSLGGTDIDAISSCETDPDGNIIIIGRMGNASVAFGATVLTFTNNGAFIAKLDPDGNYLWAKKVEGSAPVSLNGCAVDDAGNIFITGDTYNDTISFGNVTLINTDTVNWSSFFVFKCDSNGNALWGNQITASNEVKASSCATDATGNVIATGFFVSSTLTIGTNVFTNAGNADFFMMKYDADGNLIWAKSTGGNETESITHCQVDANGNIITTGNYQSPSISFGNTTLTTTAGNIEAFIAKYDSNGNALWAKAVHGSQQDIGTDCAVDAQGNIIFTGNFYSPSLSFGSTVLTNSNPNFPNIFLSRYDANGNFTWAQNIGGSSLDLGPKCTFDTNGDLIFSGTYYSNPMNLGSTNISNSGSSMFNGELFVAKSGNVTVVPKTAFTDDLITIYPNPSANGEFQISTKEKLEEITITNALGQIIFKDKLLTNGTSIQLSEKGIYIIQLKTTEQVVINKKVVSQ